MRNTIYIIIVLLLSINICNSQPVNDNCPGTTLNSTATCTATSGTLTAGTWSGLSASCGGLPNHDVFYNFVAYNTSHTITVTVCSTMDAVVQVYSGSCGGTSIGCFNSGGTGVFETCNLTGLIIGDTYWIRVYDFYGIATCSTFDICVTLPLAPTLIASTISTPVDCNGLCNGTAVGSWTGGYGPYSYHWTGPSSFTSDSLSITALCGGTYTFSVIDSFNFTTSYSTVLVSQTYPTFNIQTSNDTSFCGSGTALLNVNFTPDTFINSCGLSTTGNCGSVVSTDTVGTGITVNNAFSYPAPFANYYTSESQQFLYKAAELNAAGFTGGKIDAISWMVNAIPSGCISTFHQYTVKIGCTMAPALGTTFITAGLVTVFPAQPVSITTGWNTLSFPFGYVWDGVSNIIIQICNDEGTPLSSFTSNIISPYTATSYVSSAWVLSDIDNQCGSLTGFASTALAHPNIKFHHCSSTINSSGFTYLWTPSSGNIANDTAQHTTAMPAVTTPYIITVTDTTTGCYKKDTVNVTVNSCTVGVNPELTNPNSITIFPNPSNGDFKVESTNSKITGIKAYNVLGECIFNTIISNPQSPISIDISKVTNGIYMIEIITTSSTFRKRIIKE